MEKSSKGTLIDIEGGYYQEAKQLLARGERIGGVLWMGAPAETDQGVYRERNCQFSEAAVFGREWIDMPRCLKQINVSCDQCMRFLDKPFFKRISRD